MFMPARVGGCMPDLKVPLQITALAILQTGRVLATRVYVPEYADPPAPAPRHLRHDNQAGAVWRKGHLHWQSLDVHTAQARVRLQVVHGYKARQALRCSAPSRAGSWVQGRGSCVEW